MSRTYFMVIGEITDFKQPSLNNPNDFTEEKMTERRNIRLYINQILNDISDEYDHLLCSRFQMTIDNELQGGFINSLKIFEVLNKIKKSIKPYNVRFSIGINKMTTYVIYDLPLGSDGPAYHNARKGLNELKKEKKNCNRITTSKEQDPIINSLLEAITYINKENITKSSIKAISTYLYETFETKQSNFLKIYYKACEAYENKNYNIAIDLLNNESTDNYDEQILKYYMLTLCYDKIEDINNTITYATKTIKLIQEGNYGDYINRLIKLYEILSINYQKIKELALSIKYQEKASELRKIHK